MSYATTDQIKDAAGGVDSFVELFDWENEATAGVLGAAAAARLARMQAEVEAWIDSKLGTRYGVPLSDPSGAFAALVADEVVYKARSRRNMVTETHHDGHKERAAWVNDLATGKAVPSDPQPTPAASNRSAWIDGDCDDVSREGLKGLAW